MIIGQLESALSGATGHPGPSVQVTIDVQYLVNSIIYKWF